MTSSNRVRVALVRETVIGTTPVTPRMRTLRLTGESLNFAQEYVDSDEIRADRMLGDPIEIMQASTGGVNFELSYPEDNTPLSELIRSAMFNPWVNTPTFFNDITADSVITDAGTVANTYAVASGGAAVVVGMLVRATGFMNGANNQVFRAVSSSGTTIVGASLGLVAETAPPATAKLKVVGFAGAAADITAGASGLLSTLLDFTTLGLLPGMWIKVGGTAAGDKFATAANNDWIRITAIAAAVLTCDNLPVGWSVDAGTGKTIKVWVPDQIKNGITQSAMTIEKGFMGQAVPNYIANYGMTVNELTITATSKQKITGTASFLGMSGGKTTVALDASPDDETTNAVMAANAHVGRLSEGGSKLGSPNWAQEFNFTINNNLRTNESIDEPSPVAVREGECTVTGRLNTYFGDATLLDKFYNGTPTAVNFRVQRNGQAMVWQFPRVTYRNDGNPQAGAKNQDVMLPVGFQSSKDTLTSAHVMLNRFEYFE